MALCLLIAAFLLGKITSSGSTKAVSTPNADHVIAQNLEASFGSTLTIGGLGGDRLSVTPYRFITDAATGYPVPGAVLDVVYLRMREVGTSSWSNTVENLGGLGVSEGALYTTMSDEAALLRTPCTDIYSAPEIQPGGSTNACLVFPVPTGQKVTDFLFTLRSGNDPLGTGQTGHWKIK